MSIKRERIIIVIIVAIALLCGITSECMSQTAPTRQQANAVKQYHVSAVNQLNP